MNSAEGGTRIGGLVLCGGKSTRMGLAKATLPFGSELMVQRVVRILREIVQPLVVVAAPQQDLPPLPAETLIARDQHEERGPLEGLAAGLTALSKIADAAFVTSCDVPLLEPRFVRRMVELLGEDEIAVPVEGAFPHPLAGVYRVSVLPHIRSLLAENRLRPVFLFDVARTRRVPVTELEDVDPELRSLRNLNRPEDYFAALAVAGFQIEPELRARLAGP